MSNRSFARRRLLDQMRRKMGDRPDDGLVLALLGPKVAPENITAKSADWSVDVAHVGVTAAHLMVLADKLLKVVVEDLQLGEHRDDPVVAATIANAWAARKLLKVEDLEQR